MSKVSFDIGMTPISAEGFAELETVKQAIAVDNKKNGEGKCATFAQIRFKAPIMVKGRLFTGKAVQYLSEHLKVAARMQDEQDAES